MASPCFLGASFTTMRALNGLPLDDDLVDRILTFCPTFASLQTMILVSKAFYNVYQLHPKSITRAVAYNIVGPALTQALRVLRYPKHNPDGTLWATDKEDPETVATTCPEEHAATVITSEEKRRLREDSEMLDALENIYSLTQKDRTSKTSVLTPEESGRFRRAVYRIWLYTNIFSGKRYSLDEIDDLGADGIQLIQRQRTAVLNEYPGCELLQLYAVVRFFREILAGVYEGPDDQVNVIDILLSVGPRGILRAWECRAHEYLEDDLGFALHEEDEENALYKGYFSLPLENIWAARKMKPPKDDEPATKWILDTINGANDTCSKCVTPGGLTLLTEANWHRQQVWPAQLLKNRLKNNTEVTIPFMKSVSHIHDDDAIGPWITSIFDVPRASPEWDAWTVDLSYCQPCLLKFLEEHVWKWFLIDRVKGGWSPPENCWYGYNCHTMVHKRSHAVTKNHLCAPIKGEL